MLIYTCVELKAIDLGEYSNTVLVNTWETKIRKECYIKKKEVMFSRFSISVMRNR